MNTHRHFLIIFILSSVIFSSFAQAAGLGRLFTTPKQRAALEQLRHPAPAPVAVVDSTPTFKVIDHETQPLKKPERPPTPEFKPELPVRESLPEVVVVPKVTIPPIKVNGIVKRSGGKSTAWINGENTLTGDMAAHYISVSSRQIGKDHVHINVDDENIGNVRLKVGQSLDPNAVKINDAYQYVQKQPATP